MDFFKTLLHGILRDAFKIVIGFLVGTAGGMAVCLYYGFPLVFSFFGGVLVLALMLALLTS